MIALEKLAATSAELFNPYLKDWKEKGKKVIGYTGTYIPEEIIYAAGMLPYRIRGIGCVKTVDADAFYGPVNCSYARCCLQLAIDGSYDFLDGAIFFYECDHMRRLYDNWRGQKKMPSFLHYLGLVHSITEHGLELFMKETLELKEHLEKHFGVKITEEKLRNAIKIYNETRNLLKELYKLRKKDEPLITGAETLAVVVAGTAMPKDEYNRLLKELLNEIGGRGGILGKPRLMVGGSVNDDPGLIKLIEDLGAIVVADSLCFGAKYFWDIVEEDGDSLRSIVTRYLYHIPCPRMFGEYPKRLNFIKDMARDAKIDGVILQNIRFCDMHGADNTLLQRDLEKEGIPVLRLERQYGPLADVGRIKTRVQAFLERIRK